MIIDEWSQSRRWPNLWYRLYMWFSHRGGKRSRILESFWELHVSASANQNVYRDCSNFYCTIVGRTVHMGCLDTWTSIREKASHLIQKNVHIFRDKENVLYVGYLYLGHRSYQTLPWNVNLLYTCSLSRLTLYDPFLYASISFRLVT